MDVGLVCRLKGAERSLALSDSPREPGLRGCAAIKPREASYHVVFRKATDRECGGGAGLSFLTAATMEGGVGGGAAAPGRAAI